MENMTNDISSKGTSSTSETKNKRLNGEHPLGSMVHSASEKVSSATSEISNKAQTYMKSGRDYIKENPIFSVTVATVSGLIVGRIYKMIMRRRRS